MEQVLTECICDLWPCVWPVAVHERGSRSSSPSGRSPQPGSVQCLSATARDRSYHSETASTPHSSIKTPAHTHTHTSKRWFPNITCVSSIKHNSTVSFKSFISLWRVCTRDALISLTSKSIRQRASSSTQYQHHKFISLRGRTQTAARADVTFIKRS